MADYKNQHYVPETYLKGWSDSSGKIYVYKKIDDDLLHHQSPDTALTKIDLYTRKVEDELILTDDDKDEIFAVLNDYTVELDGRILDRSEYASNFYLYADWIIRDQNGQLAKKKHIESEIRKVRIVQSELDWHQIENDWPETRDKIKKCVDEVTGALDKNDLEHFFNFMSSQQWRTPKTIADYKKLIEAYLPIMSVGEEFVKEASFGFFKKKIMEYQQGDQNGFISKIIEILKNNHQVAFLKAVSNKYFLTSDNPVFMVIDDQFYKGKYNGMYFPITNQIIAFVYKGPRGSYRVASMPEPMIRRFNKLIKANSHQFYVSSRELYK